MRRQNVLMTGCNFPLGRCAAEALSARGHWVFATMADCFDRLPPEEVKRKLAKTLAILARM